MKQRWPILLLSVTGISALAVILCWTIRPREPAYQGRSLSYWVERDVQSGWNAAIRALGESGPLAAAAVPEIRRIMLQFNPERLLPEGGADLVQTARDA